MYIYIKYIYIYRYTYRYADIMQICKYTDADRYACTARDKSIEKYKDTEVE